MEFCINKYSGKYFIYIEDTHDGKVLLVTPIAEIKALNPRLFDEPTEENTDDLMMHGFINERQIKRYSEFIEKDSFSIYRQEIESAEEPVEGFISAKQRMSSRQWDYVMERLTEVLASNHSGTNKKS